MWKRLGLLLGAVVGAFVVTGAGQHQAVTSGPENRAAAEAVVALTDGSAARTGGVLTDAVPSDFADVMGYQPKAATTLNGAPTLVKPTGDCSAPIGPEHLWAQFEQACQTHDLGYDVLRYAALTGGELGPWAREAIDDQFSASLNERWEETGSAGCRVLTTTATAAVAFNSWRQGNGVPVSEDGTPYAAAAAMIFLALAGPPLVGAARRGLSNSAALVKPVASAVAVK